MTDGLLILTWNRTKKPLAIALSVVGRELRGRDGGGDLTNAFGILTMNPPCTVNIS
jgi:hypothetical protein